MLSAPEFVAPQLRAFGPGQWPTTFGGNISNDMLWFIIEMGPTIAIYNIWT
jgi:hypothetical protein